MNTSEIENLALQCESDLHNSYVAREMSSFLPLPKAFAQEGTYTGNILYSLIGRFRAAELYRDIGLDELKQVDNLTELAACYMFSGPNRAFTQIQKPFKILQASALGLVGNWALVHSVFEKELNYCVKALEEKSLPHYADKIRKDQFIDQVTKFQEDLDFVSMNSEDLENQPFDIEVIANLRPPFSEKELQMLHQIFNHSPLAKDIQELAIMGLFQCATTPSLEGGSVSFRKIPFLSPQLTKKLLEKGNDVKYLVDTYLDVCEEMLFNGPNEQNSSIFEMGYIPFLVAIRLAKKFDLYPVNFLMYLQSKNIPGLTPEMIQAIGYAYHEYYVIAHTSKGLHVTELPEETLITLEEATQETFAEDIFASVDPEHTLWSFNDMLVAFPKIIKQCSAHPLVLQEENTNIPIASIEITSYSPKLINIHLFHRNNRDCISLQINENGEIFGLFDIENTDYSILLNYIATHIIEKAHLKPTEKAPKPNNTTHANIAIPVNQGWSHATQRQNLSKRTQANIAKGSNNNSSVWKQEVLSDLPITFTNYEALDGLNASVKVPILRKLIDLQEKRQKGKQYQGVLKGSTKIRCGNFRVIVDWQTENGTEIGTIRRVDTRDAVYKHLFSA